MDYSDKIFYSLNEILIAQIDCSTIYPKNYYYSFLINRQAELSLRASGF